MFLCSLGLKLLWADLAREPLAGDGVVPAIPLLSARWGGPWILDASSSGGVRVQGQGGVERPCFLCLFPEIRGVPFLGGLETRALPFNVYSRAHDSWKLPQEIRLIFLVIMELL